jgi:hypothetical protein
VGGLVAFETWPCWLCLLVYPAERGSAERVSDVAVVESTISGSSLAVDLD